MICEKHLQFKKEFIKKILNKEKTITIRLRTSLREGQEFFIHAGGYVYGIGKVKRVYKKKIDELSEEEAKKEGMPLEKLKKLLKRIYGNKELYVIEFELVKIFDKPIFSEHLPYGGYTPTMIVKLAKKYNLIEKDDEELLNKLLEVGSIRKLSAELNIDRKEIRKVVRKYYQKLKELGYV